MAGNNLTGFINPEWGPNKEAQKEDVFICKRCSCKFFEEVRVQKYLKTHYILPGQAVPTAGPNSYILLRCANCQQMHLPDVQLSTFDTAADEYTSLVKDISNATDVNKNSK
jgi:hypothetical protein